ncbi:MAG: hypothetical protein WC965_12350 [Thiohalomonadaceae bacterium]
MKKKLLTAAMAAAMGAAGSAHAVHVNPDGLGQVLINPYYTVQGGFDTYVQVVNTTNQAKAVKVRFLEGKNSQEVLDFNLYLSPQDHWSATLSRSANGTVLTTQDTSCTAPAIPAGGVEFRNTLYATDSVNTLDRTREGYVEIIEMGVLNNMGLGAMWATNATHNAGVPANCAALRTAANPGGALNTPATGDVTLPTGGLYGYVNLINVNRGIETIVDAVAVDNFFDHVNPLLDIHFPPGDEQPSLNQVNTAGVFFDGGIPYSFVATTPGIDDLSAVIAHDAIMNDYVTVAGIAAKTDWVVTFPTKRFYVNPSVASGVAPARTPFTNMWTRDTSRSCDTFSANYYDREERSLTAGDDDFSPRPVGATSALCNEVNTIAMNAAGADSVFAASNTRADLALDYDAGWLRIDFTSTPATTTGVPGTLTDLLTPGVPVLGGVRGLPVIGFSAMSVANGTTVVNGVNVQSNYMGHSMHKGVRSSY